jgi:hypothetical protein
MSFRGKDFAALHEQRVASNEDTIKNDRALHFGVGSGSELSMPPSRSEGGRQGHAVGEDIVLIRAALGSRGLKYMLSGRCSLGGTVYRLGWDESMEASSLIAARQCSLR